LRGFGYYLSLIVIHTWKGCTVVSGAAWNALLMAIVGKVELVLRPVLAKAVVTCTRHQQRPSSALLQLHA
jgi:hypothetical protein